MNVYNSNATNHRNHDDTKNTTISSLQSSLYSGSSEESSEISPYFRCKVETLSDDSDVESPSNASVHSDGDVKLHYPGWKDVDEAVENKHESDYRLTDSSNNYKNTTRKLKKRSYTDNGDNDNVGKRKKIKIKEEKKMDESSPFISSTAQNMMKMMGFKHGEGLGKYGQGRTAPISVAERKGRRGLGSIIAEVDRGLIKFDSSKEFVEVYEKVIWLDGENGVDLPTLDELVAWIVIGQKKLELDGEAHFCDPDILNNVLICKSAFDKISGEEMRRARSRSNPFELIKKGPYLNRAAMKMANMDCVFDHMFTKPTDEYGTPLVRENELLYFADVCAGPGGFSEYVLSKKKWEAKGFGFTLKGDNDFKLDDFYAGPCESFEPFYGDHDDGDVYKVDNIVSFTHHVFRQTDNDGVHFMMADGGFSVAGQENIQEILSKRIYLCQFLVALSIVRVNGSFVCKLFDIFTPFSAGLIFLMYHCFKKISIHKPNTSRPANSERYIICKWKNENIDHIRDYLFHLNKEFDHLGTTSEEDINEIVPLDILKNDLKFHNYLFESNNILGERQVNSLAKILEYSDDDGKVDERQQQLKKECMEAWDVPIGARKGPSNENPDVLCRSMMQNNIVCLRQPQKNILGLKLEKVLYTVHDWHAVILGAAPRSATFYLSVTRKRCFKYDRSGARWVSISDLNLELSPETLVFGEVVTELINQSRSQRKPNVFHIIDGHTLGGKDISQLHYNERIAQCAFYAKALTRPSMISVMPIRIKPAYELEELSQFSFNSMQMIEMKNTRMKLAVPLGDPMDCNQFYLPMGIMFIKATKFPYRRFISQSHNYKYYWAPEKNSVFDKDRNQECINDFRAAYEESFVWYPDDEEECPFNRTKFVTELVNFIRENRYTKRNEKKSKSTPRG